MAGVSATDLDELIVIRDKDASKIHSVQSIEGAYEMRVAQAGGLLTSTSRTSIIV